ncbi:oxidative damage protection protein [Kaarinaea lacus]
MTRMVQCAKLGKEAEGMDRPPYPGELGQRIYESISKEAWQQWMSHQTILINENRLSVIDPKHRAFLEEQMQKFLFEGSADMPEAFVPPSKET